MSLIRVTLTTLGLAASVAAAQTPIRYAPTKQHYRLHSVVNRSQQMQGQNTEFQITNDQVVSLDLAPHTGGLLDFTLTLDSTSLQTTAPIQLPDVTKYRGTKVSGTMSPNGKLSGVTSSLDTDDPEAQTVVESMSRFLITLPSDAKVGSTWTDTTNSDVNNSGNKLVSRTITTSRILGDTTVKGERAWRIQRQLQLTLSGQQNQLGGPVTVDGKGTGTGMYYLSTGGVFLGGVGTQDMDMTITVSQQNVTVPVKQKATSQIDVVR